MNTVSASHANASMAATPEKVLVWDGPVRVFHWLMVLCFAGAYVTAESEVWRLVHVTLGYTMAGLVAFRVVWGVVGTRHARFTAFVRGPQKIIAYVRGLLRGQPEHTTGHNPVGALAIVALLGLTVAVGLTGWATYNEWTGEWIAELHEGAANLMLAVVGLHIAGVAMASWLHSENLVRTMVTGFKRAPRAQGIHKARWAMAVVLIAAVLGFWGWQWNQAPHAGGLTEPAANAQHHGKAHDNDD